MGRKSVNKYVYLYLYLYLYYGQTATWIRIPLGTKVGVGPSDIVLDGDPSHPYKKGHSSPHFLAFLQHVCDKEILVQNRRL